MRASVAGFCYHDVTDDPSESGLQRNAATPFKLRPDQFSAHLDSIAGGLAMPELVTEIELSHPGRHLLLTFDDGRNDQTVGQLYLPGHVNDPTPMLPVILT